MAKAESKVQESLEKQLFKAADKLRKNIDAAEYKHIVLGLIFLKYISDSFEELYQWLKNEEATEGADPEDPDEYSAKNVFWVPQVARWSYLHAKSKQPTIGTDLDLAMEAIEKENPTLKGILPKVYARPNLDKAALGGLIDLVGDIALGTEAAKSKDILGRVYEYFLGEFANAEGKKGGQFYTPKSIVKLLVEMIEPYHGRVYDPCCGSGGMFIMSEKFVWEHQGKIDDISIFGQESNQTTYRLARMNLAIRGIDGSQIKWNNEGSFLKDAHPDLRADFIIANPPFNQSDWGQELLRNDPRWQYGVPPANNANYGWMQHMIYHLAPNGVMGLVLANGSLSSNTSGEGEIRKRLIEADLVDCIVALPTQLFYNTQVPACLWFLSRKRSGDGSRKRAEEILFIDASELGFMEDSRHCVFSDEDISKIANTYHEWRKNSGNYENIKGFCKSVIMDDVKNNSFVLTPSKYIESNLENKYTISSAQQIKQAYLTLSELTEEGEKIDLQIKRELASVYKAYDWDKITFGSPKILEFVAHTMFKEWFVDFNFPDKNGNPYKSNGGVFEESELGAIPRDWEVKSLDAISHITIGRTPPRQELEWFSTDPKDVKWISIRDLGGIGVYTFSTAEYLTREAVSRFNIPVIPKNTVIVSFKLTVGRIAITTEEMLSNEAIAHIRINEGSNLSPEFLYCLLKNYDFNNLGSTSSIATAVNSKLIKSIKIVAPTNDILIRFNQVVSSIFKKILLDGSHEQKLTQLLDRVEAEISSGVEL